MWVCTWACGAPRDTSRHARPSPLWARRVAVPDPLTSHVPHGCDGAAWSVGVNQVGVRCCGAVSAIHRHYTSDLRYSVPCDLFRLIGDVREGYRFARAVLGSCTRPLRSTATGCADSNADQSRCDGYPYAAVGVGLKSPSARARSEMGDAERLAA